MNIKEKLRLKMSRGKVGDSMSTYLSYTRQACNFVFPAISEKINGEKLDFNFLIGSFQNILR